MKFERKAFVVDVNVAIVANGNRTPNANADCVIACVNALQNIVRNGVLVIDDGMKILKSYLDHLSPSGQPGVGDLFMQWIWENQSVPNRVERVGLTPNVATEFEQFPTDHRLSGFDRSDRIYVAVALGSRRSPEILNAVDTDWWHHRIALEENSVHLYFLCMQHMETN